MGILGVDGALMPSCRPDCRAWFYFEPQGETEMNLALMLLIDKQFPSLGVALQCLPGNGKRRSAVSGK